MSDTSPEEVTPPAAEPAAEPVIEPTAVVQTNDDLPGATDAELETLLQAASDAATAAVNPVNPADFDQELAEAAFARFGAVRNEQDTRADRRAAMAAAQAQAATLAAQVPARVPSVANLPRTTPAAAVPQERPAVTFSFTLPADAAGLIPGVTPGTDFGGFARIGELMAARQDQIGTASRARTQPFGMLNIRRHDTEFAVSMHDPMETMNAIARASAQRRLPGGGLLASWEKAALARAGGNERRVSLTAAAGWCAPSTTMYDLCEMETLGGLLDAPEITATRGGIRWTQNPTFAELMSANSFTSLTEAQVVADTAKNCFETPCPTFVDTRLNVAVTCLTGSFLQLAAYPELLARWGRGAMVAHAHKLNRQIIAALVAQAGAATVIAAPAGDPSVSAILSAAELAAMDTRYREGLDTDAVIEQVYPAWVLASLRADFTRRAFGDPGVSDARIMDWFMVRHIRPQFVKDWQEFNSGVAAPSIGGPAPYITALPTTVQFLSYPAGAVVIARQDVITLSNVYDSTNLTQNLFTQSFFEEGWAPIYPCPGLRLYTALNCPSGATGLPIDLDCTPAA